jgi:tetratricopeptide (TPR) repeat protein
VFRHASFAASDKRLLILRDGAAELRDLPTAALVRSFRKSGTNITQAALSPDGRTLVTTSDDRTAQLWNADNGEILPTALQFQHAGQSWPPRFSPYGRLVVLTSPGGVRVWDAATGDPISPPLLHPADVDGVAFSPDGRQLLTASDHAGRLWPLAAEGNDAEEFLLLAQFLSCARTKTDDARLVPIGANELAESWDTIRQKFPNAFTPPPADASAWYAEAARASERNQLWSAALAHLERLTRSEPARAELFDRKGRALAELGRMKDAAADFALAMKLGADRPGPWYRHALSQLHLGDQEGYRRTRDALLNRFDAETDGLDTPLVVRACVLVAAKKDDAASVVTLAERSLAARPQDPNRMRLLGAALCRAGRYEDAVRTLLEATKINGKAESFGELFLAMAYFGMGQTEQARTSLQQATRSIDQVAKAGVAGGTGNAGLAWSERLELRLLQREVDTVLKAQQP